MEGLTQFYSDVVMGDGHKLVMSPAEIAVFLKALPPVLAATCTSLNGGWEDIKFSQIQSVCFASVAKMWKYKQRTDMMGKNYFQ